MTKKELNTHIEKRYSECRKRSQGLSYGSFYDGYVDCYCEQQKQVTDLENKLANVSYQLEGREIELKELQEENKNLRDNYELCKATTVPTIEELQKENEGLKNKLKKQMRCAGCIHSDSPCMPNDYEEDEEGFCSNYSSFFAEFEKLKGQIEKAKELLGDWLQIAHKNQARCYGFVKDTEQFLAEK